jgi:hypothetical protein
MSDLEQRVREALADVAGDAPTAGGLAEAARGRARGRRRSRVTGAAAAAVAAVVIPLAITFGGDAPGGGPVAPDPGGPPTSPTSTGPAVPEGWRVETWRRLTVAVPGDWAEGGRSAWCAGDGDPAVPVVQGPDTVVEMIACSDPEISLGLTLGPVGVYSSVHPSGHVWLYERGDAEMYLDGSWLGQFYDEQYLVQVNAADRETVERILATVEVAERDDPERG